MRKNSAWLFGAVLVSAGCSSPSQPVYVNLESILVAQTSRTGVKLVQPKPPSAPATASLSLPALPQELVLGESASVVDDAQKALQQNRINAFRELEKHLKEVYLAEVLRDEQAKIDALEPAKNEAEQHARDQLRQAFEAYAVERGARIVRIALIAGFPDPDPRSLRQPASDSSLVKARVAEAKRLRSEIANLDLDYETAVRKLMANVSQEFDAALTEIKVNMEYARSEADARARRDAAKQVRTLQASIGESLAGKGDTVLPAIPGKAIGPAPAAPVIQAPQVRPITEGNDAASRLARLHSELTIWLSVNGYREVNEPTQGQDRTSEFAQWRKSHHLGL